MFKQGAGNGFFWLRDTQQMLQTKCSLHIKVLLVTLNTLHPEYHLLIVFSAKIIIRPTSKKNHMGLDLANEETTIPCLLSCHQKHSLNQESINFQKSRCHYKILGARRVTCIQVPF